MKTPQLSGLVPCPSLFRRGASRDPLLLVAIVVTLSAVTACGGRQGPESGVVDTAVLTPGEAVDALPVVALDQFNLMQATGDTEALRGADWFTLHPRGWPADEGEVPSVGFGRVRQHEGGVELVEWALRDPSGLDGLAIAPANERPNLEESKAVAVISAVEGDSIVIDAGQSSGVTSGDMYFVLNRDVERWGEGRMGSHIGALARITDVQESSATARIVHSDTEIRPGDCVWFAQLTGDVSVPEVYLVFAPATPGGRAADGALPALATALPEYLAEYELGNIIVETWPEYIDPTDGQDADEQREALGEERFGALVFGHYEDDVLIYNATAFGVGRAPGTTIGVLPGGLPLPAPHGLSALSEQLVPSYVATALAMRGEHALAIYFLETALRSGDFEPGVRYHLREHLAARYESLGRTSEAFRLMNADIEDGRDSRDLHVLLNALSIRTSLDRSAGARAQWLLDAREFIDIAENVLPRDSLTSMRLYVCRALRANEEYDMAQVCAHDVLQQARAAQDRDIEYAALAELAVTSMRRGQPDGALLVLRDITQRTEDLRPEQRVFALLLMAEIRAYNEEDDMATRDMVAAIGLAEELDSPVVVANAYMQAAAVLQQTGRSADAIQLLQAVSQVYLATTQFSDAADALLAAGYLSIRHGAGMAGADGLHYIADGRANLLAGAELLYFLGDTRRVAQSLASAGVLEFQLRRRDSSVALFEEATRLARLSADYRILAEISERRSELALAGGDAADALRFRAEAEKWAAAGSLEIEFAPIDVPSD